MCERERESVCVCVKTQGNEDWSIFAGSSQVSNLRSDACTLHMTGMRRVRTGKRQLCFTSVSRVKPSREIPMKHFVLLDCHFWYTLSVPTLYIPTLPTDVEEWFRKKALATNLESYRLLYAQFSTHLLVDFPQILHFHFHTTKRLIA